MKRLLFVVKVSFEVLFVLNFLLEVVCISLESLVLLLVLLLLLGLLSLDSLLVLDFSLCLLHLLL